MHRRRAPLRDGFSKLVSESATVVRAWPPLADRQGGASELEAVNTNNVGKLKILCTYDTKEYTNFKSGLIMVNSALICTTSVDR